MRENPLETNKKVLIWLWMCPADKSTDKREIRAHTICFIFVSATMLTCVITSAVFFLNYVSTDFGESLYALFEFTGAIGDYLLNLLNSLNNVECY